MEELIYVYTNSKILNGKPKKKDMEKQEWYQENQLVDEYDSKGA